MTVSDTGSATPETERAEAPSARRSVLSLHTLEAAALPLLTLGLIVFFSLWPATADTFPTLGNLRVTVISQSVLVIIAMASLLPIIGGAYDFSVGAICGLASMTVAALAAGGTPLWLAIVGGAIVGALIGCFNGYLVTVINVDSVVVTLGMTIIVAGLVNWRTGGQAIVSGIPKELTAIAKPWLLGFPGAFYIALLITLATYYLLRHVPYGRYLEAVGTNRSAARLVGLRPGRLMFVTFVLSGVIAALAGAVQVGVAGSANPNVGPNFTLPAIAAVFLSVAAITPGRFNVAGTFIAIVFLAVLNSGLTLSGAPPYVNDFANGAALIVGVAAASLIRKRRTSS